MWGNVIYLVILFGTDAVFYDFLEISQKKIVSDIAGQKVNLKPILLAIFSSFWNSVGRIDM